MKIHLVSLVVVLVCFVATCLAHFQTADVDIEYHAHNGKRSGEIKSVKLHLESGAQHHLHTERDLKMFASLKVEHPLPTMYRNGTGIGMKNLFYFTASGAMTGLFYDDEGYLQELKPAAHHYSEAEMQKRSLSPSTTLVGALKDDKDESAQHLYRMFPGLVRKRSVTDPETTQCGNPPASSPGHIRVAYLTDTSGIEFGGAELNPPLNNTQDVHDWLIDRYIKFTTVTETQSNIYLELAVMYNPSSVKEAFGPFKIRNKAECWNHTVGEKWGDLPMAWQREFYDNSPQFNNIAMIQYFSFCNKPDLGGLAYETGACHQNANSQKWRTNWVNMYWTSWQVTAHEGGHSIGGSHSTSWNPNQGIMGYGTSNPWYVQANVQQICDNWVNKLSTCNNQPAYTCNPTGQCGFSSLTGNPCGVCNCVPRDCQPGSCGYARCGTTCGNPDVSGSCSHYSHRAFMIPDPAYPTMILVPVPYISVSNWKISAIGVKIEGIYITNFVVEWKKLDLIVDTGRYEYAEGVSLWQSMTGANDPTHVVNFPVDRELRGFNVQKTSANFVRGLLIYDQTDLVAYFYAPISYFYTSNFATNLQTHSIIGFETQEQPGVGLMDIVIRLAVNPHQCKNNDGCAATETCLIGGTCAPYNSTAEFENNIRNFRAGYDIGSFWNSAWETEIQNHVDSCSETPFPSFSLNGRLQVTLLSFKDITPRDALAVWAEEKWDCNANRCESGSCDAIQALISRDSVTQNADFACAQQTCGYKKHIICLIGTTGSGSLTHTYARRLCDHNWSFKKRSLSKDDHEVPKCAKNCVGPHLKCVGNGTCICKPTGNCTEGLNECGKMWNGCNMVNCGTCSDGKVCLNGKCAAKTCVATTSCAKQGKNCGRIWTGCEIEDCGLCVEIEHCDKATQVCKAGYSNTTCPPFSTRQHYLAPCHCMPGFVKLENNMGCQPVGILRGWEVVDGVLNDWVINEQSLYLRPNPLVGSSHHALMWQQSKSFHESTKNSFSVQIVIPSTTEIVPALLFDVNENDKSYYEVSLPHHSTKMSIARYQNGVMVQRHRPTVSKTPIVLAAKTTYKVTLIFTSFLEVKMELANTQELVFKKRLTFENPDSAFDGAVGLSGTQIKNSKMQRDLMFENPAIKTTHTLRINTVKCMTVNTFRQKMSELIDTIIDEVTPLADVQSGWCALNGASNTHSHFEFVLPGNKHSSAATLASVLVRWFEKDDVMLHGHGLRTISLSQVAAPAAPKDAEPWNSASDEEDQDVVAPAAEEAEKNDFKLAMGLGIGGGVVLVGLLIGGVVVLVWKRGWGQHEPIQRDVVDLQTMGRTNSVSSMTNSVSNMRISGEEE